MKSANQVDLRTDRNLYTAEAALLRYGLALIFLWIGAMKFTAYEAQGIRPLAENSPLMSWLLAARGVQAFSNLLGVVEMRSRRGFCWPFALFPHGLRRSAALWLSLPS